jgi:hypothetical protein
MSREAAIAARESPTEVAALVRAMPEESRRYKHVAPVAAALLASLDARAAAAPPAGVKNG